MSFNPAISLLLAFIFSLLLSFSNFELIFLLPIAFLIIMNYKNIFKIFKKLLFLNIFVFILSIFVYFEKDIYEALNLFFRVNLILLFNLLLFFNSKGFDIVRGFSILRFPKKFISTLYFTIKMVLELSLEIKNIKNSLVTRNFKAGTNIFTYQTFGNIFGLIFLKTIKKSITLKESFEYRFFNGEIFLNDTLVFTKYDIILIFFVFTSSFYKVFL